MRAPASRARFPAGGLICPPWLVMILLAAPPSWSQSPVQQGAGEKGGGADKPALEQAIEAGRNALQRIWVPRQRLKNGAYVREAFRDVIANPARATARIECDGKAAALGGVVGPNGWILTKASLLEGELSVILWDLREFDARLVGVDRDHDLAVLKIEAKDLPSLELDEEVDAEAGAWVATPGLGRDPVAIGVVSVRPRRIPHRPGILGVSLDLDDSDAEGALVVKVFDGSGAQRAGVLVNDQIIRVAGRAVKNRLDLIREIRRFSPLDEVELQVLRGDREVTLKAVLSGEVKDMFPQSRSQYQNSMGSRLSRRRFGFPSALQHDTVLKPSDCGGPLVDLDGRVVGFNVARAGRTESYAIPTRVVLPLMYKLMGGQRPPAEGAGA